MLRRLRALSSRAFPAFLFMGRGAQGEVVWFSDVAGDADVSPTASELRRQVSAKYFAAARHRDMLATPVSPTTPVEGRSTIETYGIGFLMFLAALIVAWAVIPRKSRKSISWNLAAHRHAAA